MSLDSAGSGVGVTWGGANSKRDSGPRRGKRRTGGAHQIELFIHNPVCVTEEMLSSLGH